MLLIGKSIAIKGEVSCDGDPYIDGQVTFGKFNQRYSPKRGTRRIRLPLATKDITEALKLRKQKEDEINGTEPEGNGAMLKAAVTKYCADILATKKKTTAAAYAKSRGYFLLSTGSGFNRSKAAA
jgi:hypothetical protein